MLYIYLQMFVHKISLFENYRGLYVLQQELIPQPSRPHLICPIRSAANLNIFSTSSQTPKIM